MKILSIETSCDDTGIAVLEVNGDEKSPVFNVLANVITSQVEMGKKYGGVFPAMAKREHQRNLLPVLLKALKGAGMCHSRLDPESGNIKNARTLDSGFRQNDRRLELKKILEREPELLKKLIPFFKKYSKPDVDLISVTNGPGLEPCLWVGVNFAKALAYFWDIPVVPVNHIESHILVNWLPVYENSKSEIRNPKQIKFPAIALVVSGGHTQIILVKKIGSYEVLGETRDDAAGECFDKCAKILGLEYPGGPLISKLAQKAIGTSDIPILPRPMINTKDYDFSFSGLKTAVLYAWQKLEKEKNSKFFGDRQKTYQMQIVFAKEVQRAIIDVLIKKTMKAVKDFNAKTLILGGGVSANSELRKQFLYTPGMDKINFVVPEPSLSTDNGLMTAITGFYHKKETKDWKKIEANGNLRVE